MIGLLYFIIFEEAFLEQKWNYTCDRSTVRWIGPLYPPFGFWVKDVLH